MEEALHRCSKSGDGNLVVKNGKTSDGRQRYKCKVCGKRFLKDYVYKAYEFFINTNIQSFLKEGVGIRSISRLLGITTKTVLSRLLVLAGNITKPFIAKGKVYELDELCSYVAYIDNRIWVAYALRRDTREVVDLRTNKTLKRVTDTLILSEAKRIYTDKLRNYKSLIPKRIHKTKQFGTNHIERKNLTLRTHLKRLNRRTICFTKKQKYLEAQLKLYFWA